MSDEQFPSSALESLAVARVPRRSFLKGVGGVALGASLGGATALGRAGAAVAASPNKNLVVGFDGGSFQDWLYQAISKPFAKKYGAHVKYDSTLEPDRLAKAIVTKGHHLDDIEELDSKDITKAISAGVAQKLDKKIVTNWKYLSPKFRNDYWASIIVYYFGIVYRTDKIPEGITSWFDLWNPKYQGHVGLPDFNWEGFEWLLIINHVLGGNEADFSKGIAKIATYAKTQAPTTVTSSDNGVQLFTSGQIWAAPFFDGRARQLQQAGVPVKFVFPKEGAAALGEGLAIMKQANTKLANEFINFALQPAQQIAFAKLSNYSPTSSVALSQLPASMKNLLVPASAIKNLLSINDALGYAHISDAQTLWNEQVA